MMCDARVWRHQTRALETDYNVVVLPIHGASSIERIAEQVLLVAPEKFVLAGLSMGGIVAMEVWRQSPDRITHLGLFDTNYLPDPPERQRLRMRQMEQVEQGELRRVLSEELKPNYLARIHRGNQQLLDEVLDMGMSLGTDVFIRQSLALKDRPDSTGTLPSITIPTLVVCGDEDQLCPVHLHETMAGIIPGTRLQVIENCGHLSTLEQPQIVSDALRSFLEAN